MREEGGGGEAKGYEGKGDWGRSNKLLISIVMRVHCVALGQSIVRNKFNLMLMDREQDSEFLIRYCRILARYHTRGHELILATSCFFKILTFYFKICIMIIFVIADIIMYPFKVLELRHYALIAIFVVFICILFSILCNL